MNTTFFKHFFTILLIFVFNVSIFAQKVTISRVEPPSWWTGMKNPNLQLLVYGDGISSAKPVIDYQGVDISGTSIPENPNYIFIDLVIDPEARPGTFPILFKVGRKTVAEVTYELKARRPGSANRKGFDQSDVIYLLFPDRFANGNEGNDSGNETLEKADRSNPNGRHGGDIKGVADHLDYISDMGFTAVWFNPLLENNMPAYSYHGYAITDFYKVDPRMGTNEDYRLLVGSMHQKGLKVIMDMIFNHCGSNHYWINDLPSQDWIHQFPEFTRSNFRGGSVFDPYASDTDRERFQKGWFDTSMPDLNQNNEFLLNYLIQNSIWWIEYAGLDGIRMDTYPYPYPEAMAEWAKRVLKEYPDFSMVGEVWLSNPSQVAAWQAGDKMQTGLESNLPYVFDFPMYDAFRYAFSEQQGWSTGIIRMYDILTQDYLYAKPLDIVTFADNHDGDRLYSKLGEDPDRFKLAMAFLMTTRGVPQVYYGTEVLMTGLEHNGHGDIRKDFPGGWTGDSINAFTREGLNSDQVKAVKFMERLLNWRKNKAVIHTGKLKHFIPVDGLYVYFRYDDNDKVMVVLNTSDKTIKFDPEYYGEMVDGYTYGKNILAGKTFFLTKLNIPAHTPMVLELR
nr:glycoside hydrolase family 13 protein [Bacteroidota bacterium]